MFVIQRPGFYISNVNFPLLASPPKVKDGQELHLTD
jgi:hypothetical protein